jgi:hypothetical protein
MSDPWDPPLDLSGGYFVAEYRFGNQVHRQRMHVAPYNATTFNYTVPYTTEISVQDTIVNWFTQWQAFYTSSWTMNLLSLWHAASGVFSPITPPAVSGVSGTNTNPESSSPAGEAIWIARTPGGNKFKLILIAPAQWDPAAPVVVTPASSGPPGALATYLTGGDTGIVARDNTHPDPYFYVSYPINDRLYRHYHLN